MSGLDGGETDDVVGKSEKRLAAESSSDDDTESSKGWISWEISI